MFQDFPGGILWLSQEAVSPASPELSWTDNPVNGILSVVCLLVAMCDIKDFFIIWKPLIPALARWKPLVSLEYNM